MGANYDIILCNCSSDVDVAGLVAAFLSERGFEVAGAFKLNAIEIDDDKAILLSPNRNGFIELAALSSGLKIRLMDWFDCNPLAVKLSSSTARCIHLWSLDSGYDAGYSVYSHGSKVEGDVVFNRHAQHRDQLLDGVPTPASRPGGILADMLGTKYDFVANMSRSKTLESGMASLVARFGFQVHLVDFYEALETKSGIAVVGDAYSYVDLTDWTALRFRGVER